MSYVLAVVIGALIVLAADFVRAVSVAIREVKNEGSFTGVCFRCDYTVQGKSQEVVTELVRQHDLLGHLQVGATMWSNPKTPYPIRLRCPYPDCDFSVGHWTEALANQVMDGHREAMHSDETPSDIHKEN